MIGVVANKMTSSSLNHQYMQPLVETYITLHKRNINTIWRRSSSPCCVDQCFVQSAFVRMVIKLPHIMVITDVKSSLFARLYPL